MTRGNLTRRRRRAAIAGLAGVMGAIAAGANPPPPPGDKTMTTALPVAFYRTETLEDLAAVASGGGYLITVEHTRELAETALAVPCEKTMWRFWKPGGEGAGFHEAWHGGVVLPMSSSVVMTLQHDRLMAATLENEPVPGFLLSWEMKKGDPPRMGETIASHAAIELDRREAAEVYLKPQDEWNTRMLPGSEWLFHPSLASLPGGAQVAFAADTADGRAVVWIADGAGAPKTLASVPGALNPVVVRISGKDRLLYRRMPADWPVFNHDLRYSGKYGPIALPLAMAELEPGGAAHATDLSKDHGVGNVFDFAAAVDGSRLVLAAIGGARQAPELRIYLSSGADGAPELKYSAALRSVPYRLTMAVTDPGALIGLAYTTQNGFELDGAVIGLR
jgi:hypothetical protein